MQLSYLSKTPGIGGTLKNAPEDFIVEEVCEDGTILELIEDVAVPAGAGSKPRAQ